MVQGESEIDEIELFLVVAQEVREVLFLKTAWAGQRGRFFRGQGKGRRGEVNPGVGGDLCYPQGHPGHLGIAAGEVKEGEGPGLLLQFAAQDVADFAMEEGVVLDAETVDVPLREKGVDGFRHGGRRGRRASGRHGRATRRSKSCAAWSRR